jgi:hypothetical protein
MNLQPVECPPDFSYTCVGCKRRYFSKNMAPVADLDGPAFAAYYCFGCDPMRQADALNDLHLSTIQRIGALMSKNANKR